MFPNSRSMPDKVVHGPGQVQGPFKRQPGRPRVVFEDDEEENEYRKNASSKINTHIDLLQGPSQRRTKRSRTVFEDDEEEKDSRESIGLQTTTHISPRGHSSTARRGSRSRARGGRSYIERGPPDHNRKIVNTQLIPLYSTLKRRSKPSQDEIAPKVEAEQEAEQETRHKKTPRAPRVEKTFHFADLTDDGPVEYEEIDEDKAREISGLPPKKKTNIVLEGEE